MKIKNLFLTFNFVLILVWMVNLGLSYHSMLFIWLVLLILSFKKSKNHFISLLLILEMLSLSNLMMAGFYTSNLGVLSLMFMLMSLSVGEAVLGLSVLVKFMRVNSSDLILSGLA